ncbi:MAG: PEP-CTERM sorting domain-containing protein [Phycisphaerae bacterium]|nr:PEP-CTERM sorting domain-containing protein [Phycisphaerae bacterium]
MRYLGAVAVIAMVMSAPAFAGALNSGETLDIMSRLTFGNAGEGDSVLNPSNMDPWGMVNHGSYGDALSRRYFDGGGTQAPGLFEIAFKNDRSAGDEYISHVISSKGPAVGSLLYDGTEFDGTALWLAHSVFAADTAPSGDEGGAEAGSIAMASKATQIHIIPQPGTTTSTYYFSADVYMPDHSDAGNLPTGFHVGPYFDVEGYGLRSPGGMGGTYINMANFGLDAWHLFEMRAEFTITGADRADDDPDGIKNRNTLMVTLYYYVDETLVSQATWDLNESGNATGSWINQFDGSINIGTAFGLQRGWQGSAPEVFFDNITTALIVIPEPATMSLLALGGLALLRRRK